MADSAEAATAPHAVWVKNLLSRTQSPGMAAHAFASGICSSTRASPELYLVARSDVAGPGKTSRFAAAGVDPPSRRQAVPAPHRPVSRRHDRIDIHSLTGKPFRRRGAGSYREPVDCEACATVTDRSTPPARSDSRDAETFDCHGENLIRIARRIAQYAIGDTEVTTMQHAKDTIAAARRTVKIGRSANGGAPVDSA